MLFRKIAAVLICLLQNVGGWMKVRKILVLGSVFTLLVLNFQNCAKSNPEMQFSNSAASQPADSGQPYDGKIFVLIGDMCPDNTAIHARIIVNGVSTAELNRENCQDIAPVVLAASEYQVNPTNPAELVYKAQTFVSWSANTVGAGAGVSPKLTSPVDPTAYGAKGDGITDNTAAFLSALNAGDMLIPAGTYLVNGTVKVPTGRNIQCASPSAVKIVNPNMGSTTVHTFQFWSVGGSISNCTLVGANNLNPNGSAVFDVSMQFNILVSVVDYWAPAGNVKVINNVFENCHGNACVSLYGASGRGVSNTQISYNTFKNCGYFGVVIDAGSNNVASYNSAIDCGMTVANDAANSPNLNNIFEYNYLTVIHGNGRMFTTGGVGSNSLYLTGGQSAGADYSSNIMRYNTVVGNGTAGSIGIARASQIPAQYLNNSCTGGCVLR